MALLENAKAELKRRSATLPQEILKWEQNVAGNKDNLGIHKSQFVALKIMMDGLQVQQDDLLHNLSTDFSPEQFADDYFKIINQLVGSYELWRIFRYILTQREDQHLHPLLDAADLIANDCYRTPIKKALEWGLISEDKVREPPLTYLEAELSPSTASRGYSVTALSFPLRFYRNLRLPIPIVLLPYDHATSIWMYCSLHHEVGHNLDQDLKLSSELEQKVMLRLGEAGVPDERRRMWVKWVGEILADAFGVLLGGAGFAYSLNSFLMVLAPSAQFQILNPDDPHPPFYVRLRLLANMLRLGIVPSLLDAAVEIMQLWEARQKPNWVTSYVQDCEIVADLFLTEPLAALKNHSISEMVPDVAGDMALAERLVNPMLNGFNPPSATQLSKFPFRLIPVAAQLAFTRSNNLPETFDLIQERALQYLSRIDRPEYLAGVSRQEFLRQLTRELEFNQ
ncbi:MAG: hypothetical protein WBP93_21970 [Pyrinomonadaceae bacterium]